MAEFSSLLLFFSSLCCSANLQAASQVENFVLLDHHGKAQELYYQSDQAAVVIVSHQNACPDSASTLSAVVELQQRFPEVRFWLIDPEDDRSAIRVDAGSAGVATSILEDNSRIISESLGFTHSGELVVLDPASWTLVYRGTIAAVEPMLDAFLSEELSGELAGTLDAGLDRQPIPASGPDVADQRCRIHYQTAGTDHAQISYSNTIAPMLKENCAYCHVQGGIGPWPMASYEMIQGFAPMIREVLRTKRMPPWHADPHIGHWQDDRAMSAAEITTLVHWIDAGAPRGEGPDPLLDIAPLGTDWPLGKPDLIVEIPGFEVPASGVVDYQFPYVKNELEHGVWITAATVLPGDRRVVHHVLAGSIDGTLPPSGADSVMDNYIIGYAPGAESYLMPEGTGVYIAPGGHFTFQLHYTPIGTMVVDNSRMGLYFAAQPPANFLRNSVVISPNLNIPPNTAEHEEAAYYEFDKDAVIHTLFPHSHYRGKSSTFEVQYPDGELKTVLSVPNYDFNWQRGYNPVQPINLPAGSRLIHRTVYDNSSKNPANPDPQQTIGWGLQSFEEMLYGSFSFSWVDETTTNPIHDKVRSNTTQLVGFLDQNMDGKVSWRELPDSMKRRLLQGFKAVDSNGDGGLDVDEFVALRKQSEKQREKQRKEDQNGDPGLTGG